MDEFEERLDFVITLLQLDMEAFFDSNVNRGGELADRLDPSDEPSYRDYVAAIAHVKRARQYIRELERKIEGLEAFKRGVGEALNSGDGTYRP